MIALHDTLTNETMVYYIETYLEPGDKRGNVLMVTTVRDDGRIITFPSTLADLRMVRVMMLNDADMNLILDTGE